MTKTGKLPAFLKSQILEHDTEAEASLRERGDWRDVTFISCLGLVRNREMMEHMRRMMHLIQQEYGEAVDIWIMDVGFRAPGKPLTGNS